MNKRVKNYILSFGLLFFLVMIVFASINDPFSESEVSATTNPTYIIFIHGVDTSGGTGGYKNFWEQNGCGSYSLTCGIPGYVYYHTPSNNIDCVVEYYGTPWLKCENGVQYTLSGWNGGTGSTIEHFADEVYHLVDLLASNHGPLNLDLVGYSMGGLVAYYMMQTWGTQSGVTLKNIITVDSPLLGSLAANFIVDNSGNSICDSIALALTGFTQTCATIASEPQVQELESGSSFEKSLTSNVKNTPRESVKNAWKWFFVGNADTNPLANKMAAWYIPIDITLYGTSNSNDGIVSTYSASWNSYRPTQTFSYDAVHTPAIGGSGYSSPSTGTAILQTYNMMNNIARIISDHQ